MVHVQDTGMGIPEHMLDDIFRSFEQVDGTTVRTYGGTGLGLPITRKLVELMGGNILVRSVENKGSIFSFTLEKGLTGKQPDTKQIIPWKNDDLPAENILIRDHTGGS
ncbi:MAG: hypothetical protein K9K21_09105 [Desulfotignum sp.]|nr:hypothetical protein [Desulfotignum sp.]